MIGGKVVGNNPKGEAQEYTDCITFTGESSDFTLKATNKTWDGILEYSTDHNIWTTLSGTEEMQSVDKKLYLRGSGNTRFYIGIGINFVLSARAACSGNIQTLLEYSNPPTSILKTDCYSGMFSLCTALSKAPELPATTLAEWCYNEMFIGCASLIKSSELPATKLVRECYSGMFYGCASLNYIKCLANDISAYDCMEDWVYNVSSSGTFVKLQGIEFKIGSSGIPQGWIVQELDP